MLYAMGEIIIFLILAALIGLLLGWLLRGLSLRRRIESQYEREVANRQARISSLEQELRECRERSESIETEVAARVGELNNHKDLISTLEARLAEAESAAGDLSGRVEGLTAELSERDSTIAAISAGGDAASGASDDLAALRADLATRDGEIERLKGELAAATAAADGSEREADLIATVNERDARIAELEAAASGMSDETTALQAAIDDRDGTIADLRSELAAASAAGADDEGDAATTPSPSAAERSAAAEEARSRVAEIAARTAGDEPAPDDELQKIRGIGPKIDGLLRGMGITSFRQIARFTEEDIDLVAAALESFPDRMRRDDWMAGAAELHREKYGSEA